MAFIEAIKCGFRLINRNWQLVLIQVGLAVASSIGFFIIVGIPLAVAFIVFGIDLTNFANAGDIFKILGSYTESLSKYLVLGVVIIASFFLYLIIVGILGIYIFAGSIGVIGRAVTGKEQRFSMQIFFEEAKRLFPRLLGFTLIIGIILTATAFLLGILGGGIASFVSFAKEQDSFFVFFLGIFFSLILIVIALFLMIGLLSVSLYGIAALSFKASGPFESIKESIKYLGRHPKAFLFYTLLLGGYFCASFMLILLSYPFAFLPIIGTIFSFPYQLISYAFETYLGLAIIASLFIYYYSTELAQEPVPEANAEEVAKEG